MIRLTDMPPTDGIAIGFMTSEPRPVAQKMGIRPKTVVAVVIRQGRIRLSPASMVARWLGPCSSSASRSEAAAAMLTHQTQALAVVTHAGRLLGAVAETRLLQTWLDAAGAGT